MTTTYPSSAAPTGSPVAVVGPGPAALGGPGANALRWAGGVLGALLIVWASVQGAQLLALSDGVEEHTYAVAPVVELTAEGDVAVVVGEDDEVAVLARSRTAFTGTSYSARVVDDRLVVDHRCTAWWATSCDASLEVRVPVGTVLVVRSSYGSVGAAGVTGDVDLRTEDGSVLVQEVSGDVSAVTRAGDVEVQGAKGDVHARTSDGAVRVADVRGDAVARATSGSVEVSAVRGNVEATTLDGHVTVEGTGEPVALDIATVDGDTTIDAPTDPSAERSVYIRSGAGDVTYK